MLNGRILVIIAVVLLAVAWIFYVAGNAAPSWGKLEQTSVTYTIGLWETCTNDQCNKFPTDCGTTDATCSKMKAARAFMTLVCIITPFAVGCLIFILITNKFEPLFLWIAKAIAGICFVFGIIGMAIGLNYATTSTYSNYQVGAAGAVSIVGVILNFAGVIVTGIIRPG